jgi:hypothetical protein
MWLGWGFRTEYVEETYWKTSTCITDKDMGGSIKMDLKKVGCDDEKRLRIVSNGRLWHCLQVGPLQKQCKC